MVLTTPKWSFAFSKQADKDFSKIAKTDQQKIVSYLEKHVGQNPRSVGKSLRGDLKQFWRYRVGSYRILCRLEDHQLVVLVVGVGHRKDVYE